MQRAIGLAPKTPIRPCWRKRNGAPMRFLSLLFVLILTACVAAGVGKGGKPEGAAQNPIIGGQITVTTLDAVSPGQAAVLRPKTKPAVIAPDPDAVQPLAADVALLPAAKPGADDAVPSAATAPARMISAAEKTCVRQGGTWGPAGKAGETCTKLTRDSGKQCDAQSDCEGYCLARSRSCAPFTPMFGCNEILQDNGVQVTLCID